MARCTLLNSKLNTICGISPEGRALISDPAPHSVGDLLARAMSGWALIYWSDLVRLLYGDKTILQPGPMVVRLVEFIDTHALFLAPWGVVDPRAIEEVLRSCGGERHLARHSYNLEHDPRQYGNELRIMRVYDLVVRLLQQGGFDDVADFERLGAYLAPRVALKSDVEFLSRLIHLSGFDGRANINKTEFGKATKKLGFLQLRRRQRELSYMLQVELGVHWQNPEMADTTPKPDILKQFRDVTVVPVIQALPPKSEEKQQVSGNSEPLTEEETRPPQTRSESTARSDHTPAPPSVTDGIHEHELERLTTPTPPVEPEDLGTRESESEDFDDESDEEEVEEPAAEADEAPPEKSEEVPVEESAIVHDVPVGDARDMREFFGEEGADLLGGDRDGPLLILLPGVEVPESEPPEGLEEELPRDDPYGGQRLVLDASLNLRVVEGPVEEPAEAADPGAEIPGEETSLVEPEERDHEDPPREPTEEILEDQATPITQAPVVMTGPTAEDQSAVTTRAAVSEARVTSQDKLPRAHAALERMLMILVAEYGWTHPRVLTGELLREVTQLVLGTTTRRPCDRLVMRLKRGRRIYALPVKKFGFRRGMSWYVRGLTEEVASGITDDQLRQCMRSAFERVSVAQILLDLATIPLDVLASAAELAVALPQGKVRKPARSRSKKMAVVLPPDEQTQRVHQALDRMLVLLTSVYEWPFPWVVTGEFIRPLLRYVLGDEYTQTRHYALLERMKADGRLISLDLNLGPRGRPWQVQPVTEVLPSGIADDQLKEFIAEGCAKHPLENLVAALRGVLPPEAASSENLPARRGSGEKTRESPDQSRRAAHNTQRGGSRGAVIPVPKLMLNKKEVRALIAQQERVLGQVEKALEQLQEAQVATRQLLEELYRQRG